jgi:hypothetical protein
MAIDNVLNTGSSASGKANVDTGFNLNVTLPRLTTTDTTSGVGFAAMAGKNDDGTVVAGGRVNRVYVAEGNRMSVANPVLYWDDTFNATSQNTAKYFFASTTQTGTQAAGTLNLNASALTTINTNCGLKTWKSFPLFGKSELRCNTSGYLTTVPQANCLIEFGLFTATIPGAAAPTDGVFFRYNASAELRGVISYNGTETQTAAITAPSANVNHDFVIVTQTNTVLFYIDDILVGKLTLLTDAVTQGQPFMMATQPWCARVVIAGSAPASGTTLKISDVFVAQLGSDPAKNWDTQKSGFGHMLSQGQNGGTMGTTALYSNSLAPGAGAAMTNTTAALTAGLGGQFAALPTLASSTDGIMQSYQNPVGGVNQTPRNLVIKGVRIQSVVTTTLVNAGPIIYFYSLAYGHTAVSMATVEAASFLTGGTTKAPRRIAIGCESYPVNATIGTIATAQGGVWIKFDSPIIVAPGEFIAICAKNVGTVSSAGVITFLVTYDGYME